MLHSNCEKSLLLEEMNTALFSHQIVESLLTSLKSLEKKKTRFFYKSENETHNVTFLTGEKSMTSTFSGRQAKLLTSRIAAPCSQLIYC